MDQQEIWKGIEGYPGHQVSSLGRVRSIDHVAPHTKYGSYKVKGKIIKALPNHRGYLLLQLRHKMSRHTVHRLVITAFKPNINNWPEINHINGIKTDNRIENLEWCTRQQNATHAKDNNLLKAPKGVDHWGAKLDEIQIKCIRKCLQDGMTGYKLARYFKISDSVIYNIKNGNAWKGVGLL